MKPDVLDPLDKLLSILGPNDAVSSSDNIVSVVD
jgi:hypothetical protein